MPGINKRIFGSDISARVKAKLKARQDLAEKQINPLQPITTSERAKSYAAKNWAGDHTVTQDEIDLVGLTYNDIVGNMNFDGLADLSSRTPFVRMWTAVEIRTHSNVGVPQTADDIGKPGKDEIHVKIDNKIQKKVVSHYEKIVYEIGNHINNEFSDVLNQRQGKALGGVTSKDVIPNVFETNNNEFMKPAAGITSVTSNTEGMLGAIKKTTVNFVVHNFHDYDKIYSKYFLRPGAQVFVDFGWDSIKELYKPEDLIDTTKLTKLKRGETIEEALFGNGGYVTDSYGDLETLIGFVTSFDSKVKENGSVECSLEIVSKNSALIEVNVDNDLKNRVMFMLDAEIMNYASKYFKFNKNLLNPDWTNSAESVSDYTKVALLFAASNLKGDGNIPSQNSLTTGVYWQTVEDSNGNPLPGSTKNIYISFGFLEDKILNAEFGFGKDLGDILGHNKENGNFEASFDSSESFIKFDKNLFLRQKYEKNPTKLSFIYPGNWGETYNTVREKSPKRPNLKFDSEGYEIDQTEYYDEVNDKLKKFPMSAEEFEKYKIELLAKSNAPTPPYLYARSAVERLRENSGSKGLNIKKPKFKQVGFTEFDKERNQIPLREVFVSLQVVKDAFKKNENGSVKDVVMNILDKVTMGSSEIINLQLYNSKQDNTKLSIIDRNFVNFDTTEVDYFDKLFMFKPMSKNSIVKSYDLSVSTPKGELQSMLAIQSLPSGKKLFPLSEITDKYLALNMNTQHEVRRGGDGTDIGVSYLPEIGTYQTDRIEEDNALARKIEFNFIKGDEMLSSDENNQTSKLLNSLSTKFGDAREQEFETALELRDKIDMPVTDKLINSSVGMTQEELDEVDGSQWTATSISDFYLYLARKNTIDGIPTIIPANLSLTIYGISSLVPGDIFRVDYLPERQRKLIYFQVTKVSHNINSSTWSTTLETVPRIRPNKKSKSGLYYTPKSVVLSSKIFQTIVGNDSDLINVTKYMREILHIGEGSAEYKLDSMFEFQGVNQKDEFHIETIESNTSYIEIYRKGVENPLEEAMKLNTNNQGKNFNFELSYDKQYGGYVNKKTGSTLKYKFTYKSKVKIEDGKKYYILIAGSNSLILPLDLDVDTHISMQNFLTSWNKGYGLNSFKIG